MNLWKKPLELSHEEILTLKLLRESVAALSLECHWTPTDYPTCKGLAPLLCEDNREAQRLLPVLDKILEHCS